MLYSSIIEDKDHLEKTIPINKHIRLLPDLCNTYSDLRN